MDITTLHTLDTEICADSIEWCPHPNYLSYFACGTYHLEGNNADSSSPPCRRNGHICLYKFVPSTNEFDEIFRLETAAVLDMRWLNCRDLHYPILAAANALGQVEVFTMENFELIHKATFDLNTEYHNLLTLSLDWDWPSIATSPYNRRILASDSKGDVSLLQFNGSELERLTKFNAHNFEAWICCFDKWDPNVVYTGGDDTFLHVFDVRGPQQVLTNKCHIAGVTCLLSHPKHEHLLLTGSYDDRIRLFDTRAMKKSVFEKNLGGGIWRLRSDPHDGNLILCACMYKNFSIVKLNNAKSEVKLVAEYNEHDSICYGADWCLDTNKETSDELYMATCSFYDHKLCISCVTKK